MKKLFLALMLAVGFATAQAQVTGDLDVMSDYRFRGISQTQNGPGVAGKIAYDDPTGLYIAGRLRSVSADVFHGSSGAEADVFAGWRKDVYKGLIVDVGSYNYFYPRATSPVDTGSNYDTYEGYLGLAYGPVSVKYSRTLGNGYFGTANAQGTGYYQADVNYPIAGSKFSLLGHAGHTNIANSANLNYTDYNFGVGYNLVGWQIAAKYYTNSDLTNTFKTDNTVDGQKLYKNAAVLSVSKSFE